MEFRTRKKINPMPKQKRVLDREGESDKREILNRAENKNTNISLAIIICACSLFCMWISIFAPKQQLVQRKNWQ